MSKKIDSWQTENDAHTLLRHAELCGDDDRMSAAKKYLRKQAKDINVALGERKVPSKNRDKSSTGHGKPDYI